MRPTLILDDWDDNKLNDELPTIEDKPNKKLGVLCVLMWVLIIVLATSGACTNPTAPQPTPPRADCHYPPRLFCR